MQRARRRAFEVLEIAKEGDRASRLCDLFLITLISLNVVAALVESIPEYRHLWHASFHRFERISVAIFGIEYLLRLWVAVENPDGDSRHPLWGRLRYAASFPALIDLLAILPFFAMGWWNADLRFLRVLRILRILKLSHYFGALDVLLEVVRVERQAFGAAFFLLSLGVLCAASGIYAFEHDVQPEAFSSIPEAMWWAVVTLTTVGYGDVTPVTLGGRIFGATVTVMGIGMVALPTGILASGFAAELRRRQKRYAVELSHALEDGIVDDGEREQLESLSRWLGLSEEDVATIRQERARAADQAARGVGPALLSSHKCPHCGESLEDAE